MKIDYIRAYRLDPVPPSGAVTPPGVVISNATDPADLSDSFTLPAAVAGTSTTFTNAQMLISLVPLAASVTAAYAANGDLTLTQNAAWNVIKNATIAASDAAAHGVTVKNFVDVELSLGGGNDKVDVQLAKRGTISTGGGDDTISISGTSNSTSGNVTVVLAGDGNDVVTFKGNKYNAAAVDGGTGNDQITMLSQAYGSVTGGDGSDVLVDFSTGLVTLTGNAGHDGFAFNRSVKATVADYTPGVDHIELIGIAPSEVKVSLSGADTLLGIGTTGSVRLSGVSLALADLDLRFLAAPSDAATANAMHVILSNATNPDDLRDSYELPPPAPSSLLTVTGTDMAIAGVASSVTVTASYAINGNLTLINQDAWGAIKNATVYAGSTSGVDVRNFVDVEIATTDIVDTVKVTGAKRGNISTGDGGDRIIVNGTSDSNLDNLITIRAGNSTDNISFDGAAFSKMDIDGENGNDLITVTGQAFGTIKGGAGDDVLKDQTSGALTLVGGTGIDTFSFTASGQSTVQDFETGIDKVELVGVTAGQVNVSIIGSDTVLDLGGGSSVKLLGVQLTLAQINPTYV
jgi:hypothetical protein